MSNQITPTKRINVEIKRQTNLTKPKTKKIKCLDEISKVGFSGSGIKKVNQDSYFIHKNFNDNPYCLYLGVW